MRDFLISLKGDPLYGGFDAVTDFLFNAATNTWHGEYFIPPSTVPTYRFDGACVDGVFSVSVNILDGGGGCTGADWTPTICDCSETLIEFRATPVPGSDCACFQDLSGDCGLGDPYTPLLKSITIYDPSEAYGSGYDSGCGGCDDTTIRVLGCNGLPVSGANVVAVDSTGAEVVNGTTDDDGNLVISGGFCETTVTVTHPRFSDVTFPRTTISCGVITTLNISSYVAAGYHCIFGCGSPTVETLHATHPIFGAITYLYDGAGSLGAGWYATVSYSYPGCNGCAAVTVTIGCFLDADLHYTEFWQST